MSGREHADDQDRSPFPERWGTPRGAIGSDERVEWVRASVLNDRWAVTGSGSAQLRLLREKRARLRSLLRVAELHARRRDWAYELIAAGLLLLAGPVDATSCSTPYAPGANAGRAAWLATTRLVSPFHQ